MTVADTALRHVGCDLALEVSPGGVTLLLQVAPALLGMELVEEHLAVEHDGAPFDAVISEVEARHGGRHHAVRVPGGPVRVRYDGVVRPVVMTEMARGPVDELDPEAVTYLRQSRYAPSDELLGFAVSELGHLPHDAARPTAIASWVFERFVYTFNASGPLDTAVDTLLSGRGVCRDFAHLTVALCRALEIPARLVAVYAPGLSPMDFHAVVEVRVQGRWEVLDPTRLAPRGSLVRIATGRDAADTAFVTTLHGDLELKMSEVHAVIDGDLPLDDHQARMGLP